MSDPDFLSNVERNRFQYDFENQRSQMRLLEKKKAVWKETIQLQFDTSQYSISSSAPPIIRNWKIPRFRLTKSFVEDCCNRVWISNQKTNSKPEAESVKLLSKIKLTEKSTNEKPPKTIPLVLSHLHHRESNTVIMPADMQSQCRAAPFLYEVVVRSVGGTSRGGLLAGGSVVRRKNLEERLGSASRMEFRYDGGICFILHNVPKTSENGRYAVTANDIRRWIVDGCIKDDDSMTIPTQRLLKLEQSLVKLGKDHRSLAAIGSPDENLTFVSDEIKRTKKQIEQEKLSLESARSKHFSDCHLSITLQPSKLNESGETKASWKIRVKGIRKEYYQKLIENYTKWVAMYAFGRMKAKQKSNTRSNDALYSEHFVMSVPKQEQADHFVDVGTVQIKMLPDGFGIYESFVNASIANYKDDDCDGRHCLYHGHFDEGEMSGEGTLYTDEGVYCGEFQADERFGLGTVEYSDGVILSGAFALYNSNFVTENKGKDVLDSPMGQNPYERGFFVNFRTILVQKTKRENNRSSSKFNV